MTKNSALIIALTLLLFANVNVRAEGGDVIASGAGLTVTEDEFKYLVVNSPKELQPQLLSEDSARYELLVSTLATKTILRRFQALDPKSDPAAYYQFLFNLMTLAKELDEKIFQRDLIIPDLEPVAQERYRVSKNEIAVSPEKRVMSHILLLCSEDCDEAAKRGELEAIRQRIVDGESFADLAIEYSQDPGSRPRGGLLKQPIALKDSNVDKTFRETAFELTEVGEVSFVVRSRFGYHIMRLEEITPERIYTFEEVKEPLMAEIEKRYREDAYHSYWLSLAPGDDLSIDHEAIDRLVEGATISTVVTPE